LGNTDKATDSSSPQSPASDLKTSPGWTQLISEYLSDLPRQLGAIRTILEIKDYPGIKKQAHRIKGTSGTYGLETISKTAAQLEQSAETGDSDKIITAINNITRSIEIETTMPNSKSVTESPSRERAANA
jgi:HPt (histidine-containing phosphotransfer) domain-containing protein